MQTLQSMDELQGVARVTSLKRNSKREEWMELGDEGEKSRGRNWEERRKNFGREIKTNK